MHRAVSLATAGFITQATTCLYNPAVAEAKDTVVGGLDSKIKKPKGVGGLPKKIRLVGNILVSFMILYHNTHVLLL